MKPDAEPVPASRLNAQHLQTALSAGLLKDAETVEPESAQTKTRTRKPKKPVHFAHNPEDLKDLSLEDLLIRCSDEYTSSLPKGAEPDEADYPNPEDREAAIVYLTQNHKG